MSFRDIRTKGDVESYHKRLIKGYKDRPAVVDHIVEEIKKSEFSENSIAELCVGPAQLATAICNAFPRCSYVGLDFMQPFLDYTADLLSKSATETSFLCADLTQDEWPKKLAQLSNNGRYNVIVSMQSLHDVGDADQAFSIYKKCHNLLDKNGMFINADLITQEGDEKNARPGRLTVSHHLELLQKAGFSQTECAFRSEQFGICIGRIQV